MLIKLLVAMTQTPQINRDVSAIAITSCATAGCCFTERPYVPFPHEHLVQSTRYQLKHNKQRAFRFIVNHIAIISR